MYWRIAADTVALIHALCVVVMVLGPVLGWKNPTWRGIHLFLLFVTAVLWTYYCPLTLIENLLRCRYDPRVGYQTGFLEHLKSIVNLNERYGSILGWIVRGWFVLWAVVYGVLWGRESAARRRSFNPGVR